LREGKGQLEQHRWDDPDPVSPSREEELLLAAERLEEELSVERRANERYASYREQGRMRDGGGSAVPRTRMSCRRCRRGR
jgi:hypothetical protein